MIAFHVRKEVEHGKIVNRKRIGTRHNAEKRWSLSGEIYKPFWQASNYQILKRQQLWKRGMETKGYQAPEGYEDLVFTTTKNTPISPRDTTVVMKFITERIRKKRPDFEPVTPHALRHTFATRCIERGMNPKTLQIILGHSTIQLNLYCHVTDDMLISEMSKFENYERHELRTSCAVAHSVTGVAL